MAEIDRGVHPDLVDEPLDPPAQEEAAPPRTRSSRGRRSEPAVEAAELPVSADAAGEPSPQAGETTEQPEWWTQAREAKDPSEAFKLLAKNLPRDQLERDEILSGLIGQKADVRARELIRQQQQAEVERQKREAAERGDLYSLGEMTQREIQEREQQQQAQSQQTNGLFMDGVVLFQSKLDRSLQEKVAGQTFGAGKGQAEGVAEYLQFLHDESVKLAVDKEIQRRESALRKSVLSEVNGDEPVPERESGTPGRVREVTDEQIEAMTMKEYDALFDEDGRPRPGVRHRSTRGIPLRQH